MKMDTQHNRERIGPRPTNYIPALASNLCLCRQKIEPYAPLSLIHRSVVRKALLNNMINHYLGCRCSFLAVYKVRPGVFVFASTSWYCVRYGGFRQLQDSLVEILCLSIIPLQIEYSFDTTLCLRSNDCLIIRWSARCFPPVSTFLVAAPSAPGARQLRIDPQAHFFFLSSY